eukprot:gene3063-2241_t
MKVLPESFFEKHVIGSVFSDVKVLNLPNLEIQFLDRDDQAKQVNPFSNCCILTLPNNELDENALQTIWVDFPSCWWMNVSGNKIKSFDRLTIPLALSSLDLGKNPLTLDDLAHLSKTHILRLTLTLDQVAPLELAFDREWDALLSVTKSLNLVWVFNNHFISCRERGCIMQTFPPDHPDQPPSKTEGAWSSLFVNTRQSTIISATHHLERVDHVTDTVRLDMLFEDYLNECFLWNTFCHTVTVSNSIASKNMKKKPMLSNINSILFVPHRQRLDLSVLLTTRLMFTIPNPLFRDALLPPFAMTALVSLMRRISKIERMDIVQGQKSRLQVLGIQPFAATAATSSSVKYSTEFVPSFDGAYGFQFLRDALRYISFRFQTTEDDAHNHSIPYSELELEILQQLPDVPTKWAGYTTICKAETDAKWLRWVPFASRHAIFILNKAPSCPPLNGVCRSTKDQEFYLEMLPLLKAANMSLVDLDIVTMGPQVDGRAITNLARTANVASSGDAANSSGSGMNPSAHRRRLEMAMKLMQGKVLPFGMGLPKASLASLRWKASEDDIPHGQ